MRGREREEERKNEGGRGRESERVGGTVREREREGEKGSEMGGGRDRQADNKRGRNSLNLPLIVAHENCA